MPSFLKSNRTSRRESGFSLLEALLAIGVLAVVTVQIVSVQSASMEITASAGTNQLATWALRSATAQLQYVLDAYGVDGLPPSANYTYGPEKSMTVEVLSEETSIEASRLFMAALGMATQLSGGAQDEDTAAELKAQYEQIGQTLDSQIPKDIYRTIKVNVTWKQGETSRSMDGGFLVVDQNGLSVGGGLEAMFGAGAPGGSGGEGTGGGQGDGAGGRQGSQGGGSGRFPPGARGTGGGSRAGGTGGGSSDR